MNRRDLVLGGSALLPGYGLQAARQPVIKFGQSASLTGRRAAYGKDARRHRRRVRGEPGATRHRASSSCRWTTGAAEPLQGQRQDHRPGRRSALTDQRRGRGTVLSMVEEARIVMLARPAATWASAATRRRWRTCARAPDDEYRRCSSTSRTLACNGSGNVPRGHRKPERHEGGADHVGPAHGVAYFIAQCQVLRPGRASRRAPDCVLFPMPPRSRPSSTNVGSQLRRLLLIVVLAGRALIEDMTGRPEHHHESGRAAAERSRAQHRRATDDMAAFDKSEKFDSEPRGLHRRTGCD